MNTYILSVIIDVSNLYVALRQVIGLQFFRSIVSLVLGSRYVIPSDSHAGKSSRFLTVSERSDAKI